MKRTMALCVLLVLSVNGNAQIVVGRTGEVSQCVFNGDCDYPLVCAGRSCRAQCMTDRDCHNYWVCMRPTPVAPPPEGAYPPGSERNRCVPPGTPSNPVQWDPSRRTWAALQLPPPVVREIATAVPASAPGQVATAVPVIGTGVPANQAGPSVPVGRAPTPVLQAPIGALNPGIEVRRVHRAGGLEFQRGERDDFLYMRREGGEWTNVGAGEITSEPAAIATPDGNVYAFGKGKDEAIWGVRCKGGSCGDWFPLGGILTSAPTVAVQADGSLRVTATGTDGRPWFIVGDGEKWSGWNPQ